MAKDKIIMDGQGRREAAIEALKFAYNLVKRDDVEHLRMDVKIKEDLRQKVFDTYIADINLEDK